MSAPSTRIQGLRLTLERAHRAGSVSTSVYAEMQQQLELLASEVSALQTQAHRDHARAEGYY